MNDPIAIQLAADGEGKALPLGLQGYPTEADGVPIFYRKVKVGEVGDWTHRGTGDGFTISPERADEWVRNVKAMSAAGFKPFIPGQHRDEFNAADNYGFVEDVQRDGKDLFAVFALYGDDARRVAATNSRSLYVVSNAKDAKGNVYPGETITHIALVPNPALPNLGGTMKIAASAGGGPAREVRIFTLSAADRSTIMKPETIAKLRAKLNLAADVKDEDVAEKAAALALAEPPPDKTAEVTALSAKVKTLETELAGAKDEALRLSASAPRQPDDLALAMYRENIEAKRESALANGYVTKGEAEAVDALLQTGDGNPTALALSAVGRPAKPMAFQIWDVVSLIGKNTNERVRKNPATLRASAAPTHRSHGDNSTAGDDKPVSKERLAELAQLAGVNLRALASAE